MISVEEEQSEEDLEVKRYSKEEEEKNQENKLNQSNSFKKIFKIIRYPSPSAFSQDNSDYSEEYMPQPRPKRKVKRKLSLHVGPHEVVIKEKHKHRRGSKQKVCEFCGIGFTSGQALGGHMSRSHPGQSLIYQEKLKIRENRKDERDLFKQAKDAYYRKYGDDKELDRSKIRRIKEQIRTHQKVEDF